VLFTEVSLDKFSFSIWTNDSEGAGVAAAAGLDFELSFMADSIGGGFEGSKTATVSMVLFTEVSHDEFSFSIWTHDSEGAGVAAAAGLDFELSSIADSIGGDFEGSKAVTVSIVLFTEISFDKSSFSI